MRNVEKRDIDAFVVGIIGLPRQPGHEPPLVLSYTLKTHRLLIGQHGIADAALPKERVWNKALPIYPGYLVYFTIFIWHVKVPPTRSRRICVQPAQK